MNMRILELFPINFPGRNHYRLLAAALGHDYGNLAFGKLFRKDELQVPWKLKYSSALNNAHFEVDVDQVVEKVERMTQSGN